VVAEQPDQSLAGLVRPAAPHEWRTWRDLRLRMLADAPDAFGSTLAEAQALPDAAWQATLAPAPSRAMWFAEQDGVAVGTARVEIAPDRLRSHLYSMWVAPEARRCGAGRALVEAARRWALEHGACELALDVTAGNLAASELYRAAGFVDTGVRGVLRAGSLLATRTLVARLRTLVMGVVNVTPDSFSDGGAFVQPDAAVARGMQLLREGADIVDVGGEATNPRATPITADEELRRVLPVVERLAAAGATVSIDTTKAIVARAAVAAGARIINDVSGGLFDPDMAGAIGEATYIAGHLRGRSLSEVFSAEARQAAPLDWRTVADELADRLAALPAAAQGRTWVDPGLGFGKGADPEVNLALLRHSGAIGARLGRPVVVGPSRKRFVRRAFGVRDDDLPALDAASVAASLDGVAGGANVVRVHNVALLRAAIALYTRQ
jgi:dihydropteroate synthase